MGWQVHLIRRVFRARAEQLRAERQSWGEELSQVEVDTVDSYQGREKSFIIFSCVRASPAASGTGIGFLRHEARLNVRM